MEEEIKQIKCAHCGSMYVPEKRGLHNWKKLFRRPSGQEWLTLIMMVMVIFAGFAYQADINACRSTLNNLDEVCMAYTANAMGNLSSGGGLNMNNWSLNSLPNGKG